MPDWLIAQLPLAAAWIGYGPSAARFQLRNVGALRDWLRQGLGT